MNSTPAPHSDAPDDEFLWLEDIYGDKPLDWVRSHNAVTEDQLITPEFLKLEQDILAVLDSTERIPLVGKRGNHYYNFWRDAANPKGLWRRTTWDSYSSPEPEWEVLLDVDALSRAEGVDWVWGGSMFLRPPEGEPYRRALVALSPDGGDASRYREYDVDSLTFVADGFDIPTAKSRISWAGPDALHVATDFGPGSMTSSSYPRTVRTVRRGESLEDAPLYFEIPEEHMMAVVVHDSTPGFERDIAVDTIDFYSRRTHLRNGDAWVQLDVPDDVDVSLHREWIALRPRTDWTVGGAVHQGGSLLVMPLEAFLAGDRAFTTIFAPDPATSLQSWSWTRNYLLVNLLRDVSSEILVLDPADGWSASPLGAPGLSTVDAYAVDDEDEDAGDDYWLIATGFLTPSTLHRGTIGAGSGPVKAAPSFFDEDRFAVEQHFAVSKDGTRVPYFQVAAKDLRLDGGNPTLLSGYGGFEHALTPAYSGVIGRGWLDRTTEDGRHGVYVLANIRGGGEYGPGWHRAALQENRHRAFEDFAAIAEDLVARGVTRPELLAASGRSNGGLLVGNMLTNYPELFGAISCGVPLLDMRRYTKLSAGYSWIAEYGDPDKPEEWEFVRTFSPYHLLRKGAAYPKTLIWTATSDDRVGPVQARKMAARMEAMGVKNVWFHEALEGGHAGASDNRQAARMHVMTFEFLWKALTGVL